MSKSGTNNLNNLAQLEKVYLDWRRQLRLVFTSKTRIDINFRTKRQCYERDFFYWELVLTTPEGIKLVFSSIAKKDIIPDKLFLTNQLDLIKLAIRLKPLRIKTQEITTFFGTFDMTLDEDVRISLGEVFKAIKIGRAHV